MTESNSTNNKTFVFNENTAIPKFSTTVNVALHNHKNVVITFGFDRPENSDVIALGSFTMDKDLSLKLEDVLHEINTKYIK